MKFLTTVILIVLSIEAHALQMTVPFTNVPLNAHDSLSATYSFGNVPQIFCYVYSTMNIGSITWPYQGQLYSSALPVLLKISKDITGDFADPTGTVTIFNNQNQTINVSCNLAS